MIVRPSTASSRSSKRPPTQGVLLIAADFTQIERYVDMTKVAAGVLEQVRASWPGPFTWVFPRSAEVPEWVAAAHPGIALRVTAHAPAAALCRAFGGALVSTSANPHGQPPARDLATLTGILWRHTGRHRRCALGWCCPTHRHPGRVDWRYHPNLNPAAHGRWRGRWRFSRDHEDGGMQDTIPSTGSNRPIRPGWGLLHRKSNQECAAWQSSTTPINAKKRNVCCRY